MKSSTVVIEIQKRPSLENINPEAALGTLPWAKTFTQGTFNGPKVASSKGLEPGISRKAKKALLLVSDDAGFSQNLREVLERTGRALVRTGEVGDALRQARAVPLAAVLLDLDLPGQKAWKTADGLLQDEGCPPLILLTARTDHVDFSAAIGAGFVVDKASDPTRLLGIIKRSLLGLGPELAERIAAQRALIRWLKPCSWPGFSEPTYRFWGINE